MLINTYNKNPEKSEPRRQSFSRQQTMGAGMQDENSKYNITP